MAKITVYSKKMGRAITLKEGITMERCKQSIPDAIKVKKPSMATLEQWNNDCGCEAIDGCWVEPDGYCSHGYPSWLLALGYI
jgi:hypothetical protein